MNIEMKAGSSVRKGRTRLTTTSLANPAGPSAAQRKISAIPPSASLRRTVYFPRRVPGERLTRPTLRCPLRPSPPFRGFERRVSNARSKTSRELLTQCFVLAGLHCRVQRPVADEPGMNSGGGRPDPGGLASVEHPFQGATLLHVDELIEPAQIAAVEEDLWRGALPSAPRDHLCEALGAVGHVHQRQARSPTLQEVSGAHTARVLAADEERDGDHGDLQRRRRTG